ncbi:flagellar attachment zone protein 1-like isoform X3 [Ruditapes philippinarum]|uniref:flagellar attachment zone protein 1-like isoform X3 n=1 Tax=Ruditapes philippinarum TaxID=129788 RepID=UPI00295C07CF|nr:flagellar attachment zone protein 1-like isoform X3 [Ruditapes philippinarum]
MFTKRLRDWNDIERGDQLDHFPTRENGEMYYGSQMQLSPERTSLNSLKGGNPQDSMLSLFPDDDSGFNSTFRSKSRSGLYLSDDYNSLSPRMNRSRSMTRLPMTSSQDLDPLLTQSHRMRPFEHSLRHLKDNLDDSENRRIVLVHKLKEAQETLELQNDRLNRIEGTAKTNSVLVDDLKYKEKEYRDKINHLEHSEEAKLYLKSENDRLREEMQHRIDKLDFQLRSLQAQHQVSETENFKRSNLLEQSTTALSLLENENTKLKKDKDTLRQELLVAKEALELAREKYGPMEGENKSYKHEIERIKETFLEMKEENDRLSHKAHSATSKLNELKDLTESMREENEKLASSWKQLAEEKQKLVREIDNNQENHREARARVTNLATERDRLFNEKMEMTSKTQQLMIDKEQIEKGWKKLRQKKDLVEKTKIALEEQIAEQEEELTRIRKGVKRKDEERRLLEESLHDSKNNYDELYKELSNVRAYYERSLEQISVLENNKHLAIQQMELAEHEKERLRVENDRLRELAEGRSRDLKNEREQLEEAVLDLKVIQTIAQLQDDLRHMKQEKSKADDKVQELEIKLQKSNDDVKEMVSLKQGEIDTLKSTCDRLSAGTTKKETELQAMSEKVQQVELQNERLRDELRGYKEDCEQLSDQVEDIKKLKDENRRLLQEKAENEQVIKLLETQKEVLSKSDARHRQKADSSMEKLKDIDKLTDKIEQYRSDNEHLRSRIMELEKVRDNLIAQKEELLANSELIYKKPQLEELEAKIDELRDANKQLREINEQVNEKAEILQQENATLKDAVGGDGSVVPRVELERLTREKERMQSDYDHLKQEHENLEERHQRFIIQYGHEGSEAKKDKEEINRLNTEKEALEKTVALINGQMLLVEGGKKRLDDVVDDLQTEIVSLRQQLEEAEKKIAEYVSKEKEEKQVTSGEPQGQPHLPFFPSMRVRHQPEVEALQEEINILNEQLDESKYEQDKQRRLIQTLKDDIEEERNKKPTQIRDFEKLKNSLSSVGQESLDDVGTELRDMRDELHKLMGVIESKDHAIETLENQLRTSKGEVQMKAQAMSDLQVLVSDLEQKNEELRHSVDGVRHSVEEKLLSPRHTSPRLSSPTQRHTSPSPPRTSRSPTSRGSRIPRKVEDSTREPHSGDLFGVITGRSRSQDRGSEIIKRLKPAESVFKRESRSLTKSSTESDTSEGIDVVPGNYGSKFISKQIKRSQSEKGGDRLQSLISKYRGYSDSGSLPERKIKPLSISPSSKMGLVTKGRSFGPAAPKTDKEVSGEDSESRVQESHFPFTSSHLANSESYAQKNSPILQENSATDNEVLVERADASGQTETEGGLEKGGNGETGTEGQGEEDEEDEDESTEEESDSEQKDIDRLIDSCYRTHLAFLKKLKKRGYKGPKGGKNGGWLKVTFADQSASPPKPILSVSPPKITSKVIAGLLRMSTGLSSQTTLTPDTPPSPPTSALPDSL